MSSLFPYTTLFRSAAVPATLAWAAARAVTRPLVVGALALAGDQPAAVAETVAGRLGLSGEPLSELRRALAETPALARRVGAATPSAAGRALRGASGATLAALYLAGGADGRWRRRERPRRAARSARGLSDDRAA